MLEGFPTKSEENLEIPVLDFLFRFFFSMKLQYLFISLILI